MSEGSWITAAHEAILVKYQADYLAAMTRSSQKKVLKRVRKALQDANHTVPTKYKKSLAKWYRNDDAGWSEGEGDDFERKKWKKRWDLRSVTSHHRKGDINGAISVDSNNPKYIGQYSAALTSVVKGLTEDERREYLRIAEEWNREGPPRDIQKRLADKAAISATTSFIEEMDRTMGVKMMVYMAYLGTSGHQQKYTCLESDRGAEHGFVNSTKAIHRTTLQAFEKWSEKRFAVTGDNESDSDDVKQMGWKGGKKELWPLDEDLEGHAMLPRVDKDVSLAQLKGLVRSFVTHAYRLFTNNHRAAVPWAKMNGQRWMEGWDYTVPVRDPSKLTMLDVNTVYQYWKDRAKMDEVVLRFTQADQKDMRDRLGMSKQEIREMKRRKEAWKDVSDAEDENGRDDEDMERKRKDKGKGKMKASWRDSRDQHSTVASGQKRKREDDQGQGDPECSSKKQRQEGRDFQVEQVQGDQYSPVISGQSKEKRLTYLGGLSSQPNYQKLVNLLKEFPSISKQDPSLKWPVWASWKATTTWLPKDVLISKDGFSSWREFVRLKKPHQGPSNSLPGKKDIERLCLMFGLVLYNLWIGAEAVKDPSIGELDNVPYHVIHNVHGGQLAKVDGDDIREIVQVLDAALHGSSESARPAKATRSNRTHDKEKKLISNK